MITRLFTTILLGWALVIIGLTLAYGGADEGCDEAFRSTPWTLEYLEEWRPTCLTPVEQPARTGRRDS